MKLLPTLHHHHVDIPAARHEFTPLPGTNDPYRMPPMVSFLYELVWLDPTISEQQRQAAHRLLIDLYEDAGINFDIYGADANAPTDEMRKAG